MTPVHLLQFCTCHCLGRSPMPGTPRCPFHVFLSRDLWAANEQNCKLCCADKEPEGHWLSGLVDPQPSGIVSLALTFSLLSQISACTWSPDQCLLVGHMAAVPALIIFLLPHRAGDLEQPLGVGFGEAPLDNHIAQISHAKWPCGSLASYILNFS